MPFSGGSLICPLRISYRCHAAANKIYSRDVDGRTLSAIQITTAAAISTVLDLLASNQLPQSGFIRQEDIPLKVFLENHFGEVYAKPETSVPHQRFGGSGR